MATEIIEGYLQYGVLGLVSASLGYVVWAMWRRNKQLNDEIKDLLRNEAMESQKTAIALTNALNHITSIIKDLPGDLRQRLDPKFEEIKLSISEALRKKDQS